jgi:hypothetical protein
MSEKIYQIQIALIGFKPKIWRRLLIPSDLLLSDLHKIIQTSMGWENEHLHQFIKNRMFYTVRMKDDDFWDEMANVDYKKIKISDLLTEEGEKIIYEYDFGDNWEHDVILEKILPFDKKMEIPFCLNGKMNCPPEDCGGIWGYSDMLKIIKQPGHKEYNNVIEWLGDEFDSEYFDRDQINKLLKEENYGCWEF